MRVTAQESAVSARIGPAEIRLDNGRFRDQALAAATSEGLGCEHSLTIAVDLRAIEARNCEDSRSPSLLEAIGLVAAPAPANQRCIERVSSPLLATVFCVRRDRMAPDVESTAKLADFRLEREPRESDTALA
jgi:hypothetical protein